MNKKGIIKEDLWLGPNSNEETAELQHLIPKNTNILDYQEEAIVVLIPKKIHKKLTGVLHKTSTFNFDEQALARINDIDQLKEYGLPHEDLQESRDEIYLEQLDRFLKDGNNNSRFTNKEIRDKVIEGQALQTIAEQQLLRMQGVELKEFGYYLLEHQILIHTKNSQDYLEKLLKDYLASIKKTGPYNKAYFYDLVRRSYECAKCNVEVGIQFLHNLTPIYNNPEAIRRLYECTIDCEDSLNSVIRKFARRFVLTDEQKRVHLNRNPDPNIVTPELKTRAYETVQVLIKEGMLKKTAYIRTDLLSKIAITESEWFENREKLRSLLVEGFIRAKSINIVGVEDKTIESLSEFFTRLEKDDLPDGVLIDVSNSEET